MVHRAVAVALLALAACSHTRGPAKLESRVRRVDRMPLELATGETLFLQTGFGGVTVRTESGVRPSLTTSFAVRARTAEEAEKLLAAAVMVAEREDGMLRIHPVGKEVSVPREGAPPLVIRPTADLVAIVPPGTKVRIEAGSGPIRVEGPLGALAAHASLGRVDVEGVRGNIRVRAGSGDVEIVDVEAPKLEVTSSYGNVDVDGVFLEARAIAGQGRMRFVARPRSRIAGPWEIASSFGGVEVELPTDASARIVAVTNLGKIESALALGGTVRRRKPPTLTGDLGSGGETVTLRSGSGDILLRASRSR
jgi:hypothetical protein